MGRNQIYAIVALFAVVGVIAGVATFSGASTAKTTLYSHKNFHSTIIRDLFSQWKIVWGVNYETAEHEEAHFTTFFNNYIWILNFNADTTHTSTVGLNQFADLTTEQFREKMSCLNLAGKKSSSGNVAEVLPVVGDAVDWRLKGAVTDVKNQGQCGSCWAFSSTGSLEGLNFIKNGNLLSFSEQQLVDCSGAFGNMGCNGGLMDQAFEYVEQYGIELESDYPYVAYDQTCTYDASKKAFTITGYTDVKAQSEQALESAVTQQPTSVAIEADQPVFQLYTGGVINDPGCGTNLDHGVLAVGYDTTQSPPFWIVKNSWGGAWGENGYVRIAQIGDGLGMCGILQIDSFPTNN